MTTTRFAIDPDIARASTLPGEAYCDPAVYAAARDRIFARSWQLIGDTDEVKVPGTVQPVTLLEGSLDEPLLLSRDHADTLHVLSNVCTHRGTVLCSHGGREKALVCPYHGRRFDLDGTFRHMPEFEKVEGFPSEKDNLPRIPFGQWGKFVFASPNAAAPLDEVIGPMRDRMPWLDVDALRFDPGRSRDYLVHANWALYCDNYLEGFHIPFVHASLNQALDYGLYRTELFKWCNLQLGIAKPGSGESVFDLPASSPDHGSAVAAYYWWVFPNTMFNIYPWGISVNIVRPLAVDRTRVSFLAYVGDESKLDKGAGAGLDRVEREDEAVVEAVQRGLRSRFYTRGRYSPTREQGVHHFHRLWCEAMQEARP